MNQKVIQENNLVFETAESVERQPEARCYVNAYDPSRANLVVFNWQKEHVVHVNAQPFLQEGETCVLKSPKDFFGPPVLEAVSQDGKLELPIEDEFSVFVAFKKTPDAQGREDTTTE